MFILKESYSQDSIFHPHISCGMEGIEAQSGSSQWPFFPMDNDELKVLVVFCNFPSPSGDWDLSGKCLLQHWPGNEGQVMPSWASDVICPTTSNVWHPSLTGLFRDESMGRFWLIGDVYPDLYVFNEQVWDYAASSKKIGYAVKELLLSIDEYVDYSEYDNFDPWDYDDDNDRREPDGIVDFIFIMFRFTNAHTIDPDSYGHGYTGIALLGGRDGRFGLENGVPVTELNLDGKIIKAGFPGSGCISDVQNPWAIGIPAHEFGEHYSYGGGHSEQMGAFNINGGGIASAYDREHNGWNTTNAIAPTSNTTITLRDYVTTNDYVRIQRTNDKIYLENRRRFSYYASNEHIIWRWNCGEPLRPIHPDSTLLIYHNTDYRTFDIQTADGKWDWQKCPGNKYKVDYTSPTCNLFFHDTSNRYGANGLSTFYLRDLPILNEKCEVYPDRGTLTYMGVGEDKNTCFDVEYNDVYSPWSNPPLLVNNQNDSLTIEIEERNGNGDLVINIYFTNITDAKPSKPQGLKVIEYDVNPGVSYHPKLIWPANLEPDFNGEYKIYRGSSFDEGKEPEYFYLTTITNTQSIVEYIDQEILLYYEQQSQPGCGSYYITYSYKISAVDDTELESVKSERGYISGWTLDCIGPKGDNPTLSSLPEEYKIYQNYPNPFNPVTNIQYDIPKDGFVSIKVYDLTGKKIETLVKDFKKAGRYLITFNAKDLASGIYFYKIEADNFIQIKKMVIIK